MMTRAPQESDSTTMPPEARLAESGVVTRIGAGAPLALTFRSAGAEAGSLETRRRISSACSAVNEVPLGNSPVTMGRSKVRYRRATCCSCAEVSPAIFS